MAFIQTDNKGWHKGEQRMHSLMQVDMSYDNPTSRFLLPGAALLLRTAPLLALGTLDQEGRPWTTVWGGEPGFSRSLGSSNIGVKALVDCRYDPVVNALLGSQPDGEVAAGSGQTRSLSGLAIDLVTRRREKFAGHMLAGALGRLGLEQSNASEIGEVQLLVKVDANMGMLHIGNCPKYINSKHISVALPTPKRISSTFPLPAQALELLAKADLFFLTTSDGLSHMSTNYRGGPPGFVRIMSNDANGVTLVYPEYSGNRFYQTLGNLQIVPKAGFVFPNFDNGDVLYATGTAEIVAREEAAIIVPRSNLVLKLIVQEAHFVETGLNFRGEPGEMSPYNPAVRPLASEGAITVAQANGVSTVTAKLLERVLLTPTIARFRFSLSDPNASGRWKHGQYVALSFENELSTGYSHMRDDDPRSLNDDYVRTFTVSSPPDGGTLPQDEFELIVRDVGLITRFMFRQNIRAGLEVSFKGFGGQFVIEQKAGEVVPIVLGGIGITPLLGQLTMLDVSRLRLFWTINVQDIGLVHDTFERAPALAGSTSLFVSGLKADTPVRLREALAEVEASDAKVIRRRVLAEDLQEVLLMSHKWYICTGPALKMSLLPWLAGKEIVYENFNY